MITMRIAQKDLDSLFERLEGLFDVMVSAEKHISECPVCDGPVWVVTYNDTQERTIIHEDGCEWKRVMDREREVRRSFHDGTRRT